MSAEQKAKSMTMSEQRSAARSMKGDKSAAGVVLDPGKSGAQSKSLFDARKGPPGSGMYVPDRYKAVQGKAKPLPKGGLLDIYSGDAPTKAELAQKAKARAKMEGTYVIGGGMNLKGNIINE